ncbi:hypothetical protein Afe04nite_20840 [Asanoa ferruginea]|nr:hypothetical protein Afe04nite_20840 [Asanoa ferruginea]
MRIGYSMWGFLGSGVVDTPDGARAFRRSFVDALAGDEHEMVFLQKNRDLEEAGLDLTDRFVWNPSGLPALETVVLEWRWPLPGRNTTSCGTPGHTCDLHRQAELLWHYAAAPRTTLLIWDLDRQLPSDAEVRRLPGVVVGEFALAHTVGAHHVPCPVPDEALDRADPVLLARRRRATPLVYVGNQYDRDDHFDTFFAPAARVVRHQVAGKWPHISRWPHLTFSGRAGFADVARIHAGALATVLLLPSRYREVGHMTSRWWESLFEGCLPLVPADVYGAHSFVPKELIVNDGREVLERIGWLQGIAGTREHAATIATCLSFLEPFRCSAVTRTVLSAMEKPR